jgi:hypothetical protein
MNRGGIAGSPSEQGSWPREIFADTRDFTLITPRASQPEAAKSPQNGKVKRAFAG